MVEQASVTGRKPETSAEAPTKELKLMVFRFRGNATHFLLFHDPDLHLNPLIRVIISVPGAVDYFLGYFHP